ncbi:hypothetical protein MAR_021677 [Mya arenaria]|uniref:YqaJ viral recombinase domain-containing protein n=1 Tax=Mya arenaria TaxID=6604 RepID=A0ABY7EC68_MYAAR|nr:hypothetical protein MAR_021677 [Mya arenaria]
MNDIIDSLKEAENINLWSLADERKTGVREIYNKGLKNVSEHILIARYLRKKKTAAYRGIDCNVDKNDTRQIKQRLEKWSSARKEAKVTGSSIYRSIGLEGLKQQKEYFDKGVWTLGKRTFRESETIHGTWNTKRAKCKGYNCRKNSTIALSQLHCFLKRAILNTVYMKPILIVSSDGSVRTKGSEIEEQKTIAAIELKCPVLDVHQQLPARYLLQCLAKIEVLEVDQLIYVSWIYDISTAYDITKQMYLTETPKRPTKVQDDVKALQNK